ncbi:MAG: hypothetical protein COA52_01405 [Hyphomicrobiales bacterium]|nr:MAG: hypothetical protein COA52_00315 [Hyphomicrobiales bacterium]PCJ96888.1 MAG: hypothetical protein COA52_01405 [Hyphomicrobiales bacterium]
MKGDATIACINALNKKKYNINVEVPNPFAYFSQIAWNAFINVINIEAEQRYFKYKSLRNHNHDARVAGQTFTESSQADMDTSFVDDFEGKKKEKKKKQKQKQKEKEMSNFEVNNEK